MAAFAGLSGANVAAALIGVATLPYIARLANPQQFGLAAGVMLVSGLCATVVSGRYEVGAAVADHSAEGQDESIGLARLALALAAISALVLQLGVELWSLVSMQAVDAVWRWMPLLTFASAAVSVESLLDTRAGRYAVLSGLTVARPLFMVATVWAASLSGRPVSADVLCLAYLVSAASPSARAIWLTARPAGRLDVRQYRDLARRHSKYPRLQVPAALLNALSQSLLAITVAWNFGSAALGAFSLATRLTLLPATIAGGPINTLYLRESVLVKNDRDASRKYYLIAMLGAILVGIGAAPVLVLISPHLEGLLGPEWEGIGGYVIATLPLMGALLITAPANSALMTFERQLALLGWRIALVAFPVAALILTSRVLPSPTRGVAIGSAVMFLLSSAYALFSLRVIAREPRTP